MKKQIIIQRFDGGMADDVREQSVNKHAIIKHFNHFSKSTTLSPYRSSEDAYADQGDFRGKDFIYVGSKLYSLGVVTGSAKGQINETSDVANPSWSASTGGADGGGTTSAGFFCHYKGKLYGAVASSSTGRIWDYDIAGTTFTATTGGGDLDFTTYANGMTHSISDKMFFGLDNKIYYKDGTGNIALGLTLPTDIKVSSLCEYGSQLVIACTSISGGVTSKVYFWDMVSADVSASFDIGEVTVGFIENIGQNLILGAYQTGLSSVTPTKLIFSKYGGVGFTAFKTINATTGYMYNWKCKYGGRVYFTVNAQSVGGSAGDLNGVWSIGQNQSGEFTVVLSYLPNNDTGVYIVYGFIVLQDYCYISSLVTNGQNDYIMMKTNDQATYSSTSIIETVKYNSGDINKKKRLIGIAVSTVPLPSNGEVHIFYKKDSDSSYVEITPSAGIIADNTTSFELINDTYGKNLPEFYEIQFKITSEGGAEITGIKFVYEEIPTLLDIK